MIQETDTQFETLLRTFAVSPEEMLRREALRQKIKAPIAPLFEENDTSKNLNEFCAG